MKCDTCHRQRRRKNLCGECARLAELWYAELPTKERRDFLACVDKEAMEYARKRANIGNGQAERFLWFYLHAIKVL